MELHVRLTGQQAVRDKLAALRSRLQNLHPALLRAGGVVLSAAQYRIRTNGDGQWPGTLETEKGSPLQRTGALLRSLTMGDAQNLMQEITGGIRVGTNLQTEDGHNVGLMMQYGTGIYGPTGNPITPKNGKFLVFEVNGKTYFVKSVKGSPPRKFLFIDEPTAIKVRKEVAAYVAGTPGDANG
jgi:phage gpG-like protein